MGMSQSDKNRPTRVCLLSLLSLLILPTTWPILLKAQPPLPRGRRLREIIEREYPAGRLFIGSACHGRYLGTHTEILLNREFSYVTPANDFKQTYIHPEPGRWQWDLPDRWIQHCARNKQVLRLHSPISPQCSTYVREDQRTAEELRRMLEEYMTALCRRYNDRPQVKWMDVVNETVDVDGTWFGPKEGSEKWENPWPKIGFDESSPLRPPLYIKMAFEIANRYAPNIKQIINQHRGMEPPMWKTVKKTVAYLRSSGLRVDGIGWQAHIDTGWEKEGDNLKRLAELIDWAHRNQLEFHITENNCWIKGDVENRLDAQAATFAALIGLLKGKSVNGVCTWNLWHMRDFECAHPEWHGCLWREDYTPKPAYYAVQKVLESPPKIAPE